jgi:hypothetical protein
VLSGLKSKGNLWIETYGFLEVHSVPVQLINPLKTKIITEARFKTNKLSARILTARQDVA